MTKAHLIEAVQRELDVGRREAAGVVEATFTAIGQALQAGRRVKVSKFGLFLPKLRRARTLANPHSGVPMAVKARRTVGFRAAPRLKDVLRAAPAPQGQGAQV